MRQILVEVTYGGQVTIPKEVRDVLGLKDGDIIAFTIEGRHVHVDFKAGGAGELAQAFMKSNQEVTGPEPCESGDPRLEVGSPAPQVGASTSSRVRSFSVAANGRRSPQPRARRLRQSQ